VNESATMTAPTSATATLTTEERVERLEAQTADIQAMIDHLLRGVELLVPYWRHTRGEVVLSKAKFATLEAALDAWDQERAAWI